MSCGINSGQVLDYLDELDEKAKKENEDKNCIDDEKKDCQQEAIGQEKI
jgi:hypothetical protein